MKRTKIVATIGPSCSSEKILTKMVRAGMNVGRFNFSHGTLSSNKKAINNLKKVSKKLKTPLAIIQDLQGPRIRLGEIGEKGLELIKNEEVIIKSDKFPLAGNKSLSKKIIPIKYPKLTEALAQGNHLLIYDGQVDLKVIKVNPDHLIAKVIRGGFIFSNKGVNIPKIDLKIPVITPKDINDLKFGLKLGIDYVALSFVGSAKDLKRLRKFIKKYSPKSQVQVMAKIERESAVKNIKAIIKEADAIMVARGDLGVEVSPEKVPVIQKDIIKLCLTAGKPVLVATQMLESMIKSQRPTRAEVSDVANAVIDHADAVMLSGETAFGQYPVEAVKIMDQIIERTEQSPYDDMQLGYFREKKLPVTKAISESVFELVKDIKAKAIVAATDSGYTARMIARYRPETRIIVLVNQPAVERQLALVWGIYPEMMPVCKNMDELIEKSLTLVKRQKLVRPGDKIIIVTGQPVGRSKNMNLVKVHQI
ncbi:pyruvate kinase [Patescibacteria group bacterium]|nr:pyruvate kinase [Patescibacteria group bacterium]